MRVQIQRVRYIKSFLAGKIQNCLIQSRPKNVRFGCIDWALGILFKSNFVQFNLLQRFDVFAFLLSYIETELSYLIDTVCRSLKIGESSYVIVYQTKSDTNATLRYTIYFFETKMT